MPVQISFRVFDVELNADGSQSHFLMIVLSVKRKASLWAQYRHTAPGSARISRRKPNGAMLDQETLVRVLGVLRLIALRRTRGGREYLRVVYQYASEIRAL